MMLRNEVVIILYHRVIARVTLELILCLVCILFVILQCLQ
jgi:hypothetical protein